MPDVLNFSMRLEHVLSGCLPSQLPSLGGIVWHTYVMLGILDFRRRYELNSGWPMGFTLRMSLFEDGGMQDCHPSIPQELMDIWMTGG